MLFLGIPLFRPFAKGLQSLDGVALLPPVALGILAGIFPAYGFRLEVVPILVFAFLCNISNLLSCIARKMGRASDAQEGGHLRAALAMVALAAVAAPMFIFTPQVHARHREIEAVRNLAVPRESAGAEYVLRVYGPVEASRPLVFLVPPEIGSAASVKLICERLMEKGFTVVTYFRKDYDTLFIDEKGRRHATPARLLRYWRISRRAADLASANEQGRALEDARRTDIEFLLPRLPALLGAAGHGDLPPILFVGYGAGGSALAYMAGENGFLDSHSNALGVIAVESRLWSSFQNIPRTIEPLTDDMDTILRLQTNAANWLNDRRRQQVNRAGSLPESGLPVLYLVSGRALDTGRRQRAYQAVLDAFRSNYGPVAFAAVKSAGPLDYQDYPLTQPALSFFLRGLRSAGRSESPADDTAGIIGNFAAFLLERRQAEQGQLAENGLPEGYGYTVEAEETGTAEEAEETAQEIPARQEVNIPPRSIIRGALHVESRGLPAFQL